MVFKKKKIKRNESVYVRLSAEEHKQISALAEAGESTVSEYLRKTALGKRLRHSTNAKIICELCAIGRQQKKLYWTDQKNEDLYRKVLDAVCDAITKIPMRDAFPSDKF